MKTEDENNSNLTIVFEIIDETELSKDNLETLAVN